MIRKTTLVPGLLAIACLSISVTVNAGDKDTVPAPRSNTGFVSASFISTDVKDILKTIFLQTHLNFSVIGDIQSQLTLDINDKYWNDVTDVIGKIEGLSIAENEIGIVVVKAGLPTGTINAEVPLALDPKDTALALNMEFHAANAQDVLRTIAIQGKLNLVLPDLRTAPPVTLEWGATPVTAKNAFISVAEIIGYNAYEHQGIFYVMKK